MRNGLPRDSRKAQLWRDHIRRWRQSGSSVRAYCRLHHLSEPSFYQWRRTLAQRDDNPLPAQPTLTFVPVHIHPEPATPPPTLELLLTNGRLLRIPTGYSTQELRALLTLLEEPPC